MRGIEAGVRRGLAECGEACSQVVLARAADGYRDWCVTVTAGNRTPQYLPVDASSLDDADTGVALGYLLAEALRRERHRV